jgi:hypothetical protein
MMLEVLSTKLGISVFLENLELVGYLVLYIVNINIKLTINPFCMLKFIPESSDIFDI